MADNSHFFAHLARMKLIHRWPLMHNVRIENVQEHSLQVAMVAHALALIRNRYFGGDLNPERIATLAMFHDVSEVLTGDLPTPVKYFNPAIKDEYKKIEKIAEQKLIDMAPVDFREDYAKLIDSQYHSEDEAFIVKAADVLCAYLKTLEELNSGNREFTLAKKRLDQMLKDYHSDEVDYFLKRYVPSFSLSLDEITQEDTHN
ncbi:MAG: 5'-deoxynucleotidase [Pseudomonadota bacterium]|jgi:5'-deoxynucleotidase|uniref:5'-deoxynucleotidase n=1 Tax=Marisediminitalea aggregata TaxID=634436 RepID=A0A1M5Q6M4_9ALTE|nr:5'-deoxynucleotidase [Marisediminitalea aggregata]MAP19303.1 5'-deoxynucleotidase [Alteromonadaceae bacterium]MCP3864376.1 5'-deoxynucleotidase [Aestuariibacter sp.]MEC7825202.1 5'-deoxynucleotidase [Pseudomonadota bacterium]BBO27985.1 5'-deoxynucleotidase [Alteromonas sp. I4]HBY39872.1 5'-deoxynucleotidase [Alteromonas sp.]|tara:strand:- start:16606 stop:17211 length:606 start_codon:yes stop_codon:yes gene_type:complete